jgi:hypothetical protein
MEAKKPARLGGLAIRGAEVIWFVSINSPLERREERTEKRE